MMFSKKKKTTKGRQKVELKRIENEDARYISFSKRRNGVFTKASEISTLCGAEVLVLIYSPAGKPHTFGSPDVNLLADRFFSGGAVHRVSSMSEQAYQKGRILGLNGQLMELGRSVEALKARNNAILERTMTMIQGLDLDENEDGMTLEKLAELNNKLVDFKEKTKDVLDFLTGNENPPPPEDHHGHASSSYAHVGHGSVREELLNHHPANPTNMINAFEPASSPLEPFTSLNPSGGFVSSELSELFQIKWSGQNPSFANSNPFEPEFYQGKPSSSTNSELKLNNLF